MKAHVKSWLEGFYGKKSVKPDLPTKGKTAKQEIGNRLMGATMTITNHATGEKKTYR